MIDRAYREWSSIQALRNTILSKYNPKTELGKYIASCLKYLPLEIASELMDKISNVVVLESNLYAVHYSAKYNKEGNNIGLVSSKLVTDNGVGYLVDAFQGIVEPENLKFHGVGVGTTAENQTDAALVTESTTILNPDSTRATGSLAEGASANIFRSVGTVTFDGSGAITEHGLFSQAAVPGGILWDRSVFAAINVASGDSIQFTYELTVAAGG